MVKCRSCGSTDLYPVLDLGTSPPSNAYLTEEQLCGPEVYVPLRMNVCTLCWLMQTEDFVTGLDVFRSDYAYFSSMSESWLCHARDFVANAVERFSLGPESKVAEVASNDGYLLRFVQERGIPCFGVEPTDSTAAAAQRLGLTVERRFLTELTAREIVDRHGQADLVVANNVIAHVPDIVDFARGLALLAKPRGTISLEFAYGVSLVSEGQFDTVYHEHFSYLTMTSLSRVLGAAGLVAVDVELLSTHGGSLRVLAQHELHGTQVNTSVSDLVEYEASLGVGGVAFYSYFQSAADSTKNDLLRFLLETLAAGTSVAGYGAAAKGNTLLNFAGIRSDLLPVVFDRSPHKVGKYLPGSRIPVGPVADMGTVRPKNILILPWNLGSELSRQLSFVSEWGGSLWRAVPRIDRIRHDATMRDDPS